MLDYIHKDGRKEGGKNNERAGHTLKKRASQTNKTMPHLGRGDARDAPRSWGAPPGSGWRARRCCGLWVCVRWCQSMRKRTTAAVDHHQHATSRTRMQTHTPHRQTKTRSPAEVAPAKGLGEGHGAARVTPALIRRIVEGEVLFFGLGGYTYGREDRGVRMGRWVGGWMDG